MPTRSHGRRDLVVDDLTEQRMGELRPTRGVDFEQPSATERLERPGALCGGDLPPRGGGRGAEAASQDAGRLCVSPPPRGRPQRPGAPKRGPWGPRITTRFGQGAAPADAAG